MTGAAEDLKTQHANFPVFYNRFIAQTDTVQEGVAVILQVFVATTTLPRPPAA